jgi:betaine-aldehyde dehydrogenase
MPHPIDSGLEILTDPRTGKVRGQLRRGDESDVASAVAAARLAAPAWSAITPAQRSRRLHRLADLIEEQAQVYASMERQGTGKPVDEAFAEVETAVDVLRFYAGALRADLAPAGGRRIADRESWVRWEPLGVIGVIVPWNYPLLMAAWRIGPALAAGNTVVLKPAQTTPDTAVLAAEHAAQTLGPGVLVALPGDRETGRLLVDSPVDAIAFTGSQAAGRSVAALAGVRRVSLELGGNCPAIVLPDAPEETYAALVAACTYNAGQSCAAPARVITLSENYEQTVVRLGEAMRARRAGADFGPLNNTQQLARFDGLVNASRAGIQHIADAAVSNEEEDGYWRAGRILADLPEDDPTVVEEVFGPVLTVQAAADRADAVRLANGVPQRLAASVWSEATSLALSTATELDCGEVWINCHLDQTPELPHSGRRGSGQGTDLSVLALTEYQRPKTVTVRLG